MSTLTIDEQHRLGQLEAVVKRGLETFIKVGNALAEIRDGKLYQQSHTSFDEYCTERWGLSKRRANQLVQAAQVGTMVPVENERQARELVPLSGDEQAVVQAWREAQGSAKAVGAKVTSKVIRAAVAKQLKRDKVDQAHERFAQKPCDDCGRVQAELEAAGVPMASGHFSTVDENGRCLGLCHDCHTTRQRDAREADVREHRQWWESLSDKQRQAYRESKADRESLLQLTDCLRAISGEQSVAEFLRGIDSELRSIEVHRHPQLLGRLIIDVTEIQKAAADLSHWLTDVAQAVLVFAEGSS